MPFVAVTTVLQPIAQLVPNCPTITIVKAYIDAARRLCDEARVRELEEDVTATIGEPRITLADTATEEVCGIYAATLYLSATDRRPLTEGNSGDWHRGEQTGEPDRYQYVFPNLIALNRTPRIAYPVTVTKVMKPLATATTIDAAIASRFKEVLEDGALSYLLRIPKQPWTDKPMAMIHKAAFNSGIHSASVSHARRDNAGSNVTDGPGPTNAAARSTVPVI